MDFKPTISKRFLVNAAVCIDRVLTDGGLLEGGGGGYEGLPMGVREAPAAGHLHQVRQFQTHHLLVVRPRAVKRGGRACMGGEQRRTGFPSGDVDMRKKINTR